MISSTHISQFTHLNSTEYDNKKDKIHCTGRPVIGLPPRRGSLQLQECTVIKE